jgi:antitoxin MazE
VRLASFLLRRLVRRRRGEVGSLGEGGCGCAALWPSVQSGCDEAAQYPDFFVDIQFSTLYHCYTMKTALRRIGNSQGVILPKPLLAQMGIVEGEIEMTVERDAVILRRPKKHVRDGWAAAAKTLASTGDDRLVWPELANEEDGSLIW